MILSKNFDQTGPFATSVQCWEENWPIRLSNTCDSTFANLWENLVNLWEFEHKSLKFEHSPTILSPNSSSLILIHQSDHYNNINPSCVININCFINFYVTFVNSLQLFSILIISSCKATLLVTLCLELQELSPRWQGSPAAAPSPCPAPALSPSTAPAGRKYCWEPHYKHFQLF